MRSMRRDTDEEVPMVSSSDSDTQNAQGKPWTLIVGATLLLSALLGTIYVMMPLKNGSSSIELPGPSEKWSLIPESVQESLDAAYETVHKGVSDQVWKAQHPEMMEKFKKYDVDNDGKISKKELVTWVFGPNGADEKEVKTSVACFVEKYGPKGGELSPQEMYYVFGPIIKSTGGYLDKIGC